MDIRPPRGWLHRFAARCCIERLALHFHQHRDSPERMNRGSRLLFGIRHSPWYPVALALLAMISAGTGLYPVGPLLVAATVFAPQRWRTIYVFAAVGAATGAMLCATVVQTSGFSLIDTMLPDIRQHAAWESSRYWIDRYGTFALAVIAGLPIPEMPALLLTALAEVPPPLIWLAIFCGKLFKYGIYLAATVAVVNAIHRHHDIPPDRHRPGQ